MQRSYEDIRQISLQCTLKHVVYVHSNRSRVQTGLKLFYYASSSYSLLAATCVQCLYYTTGRANI